MEMYLLKSAACLTILLAFYKIFLEKESFHIFKRFYLLAGLLTSFIIPLITLVIYVEPEYVLGSFQDPILENIYYPDASTNTEIIKENFDWTSILWVLYGLGVLFFSTRFLLNLSRIFKRIKSNPKAKRQNFINVLLNDLIIPHTFFNYIFLNKSKFEKGEIPEEVLLHEQTHAKQKHSIDILLIEIFQIVFWFNPLIYLFKNTIKLNHEFLADKAVMNQGANLTAYQQLLLAFSSNASEPQLANAINYSSIKKRFTVMKTQTSKKALWLKSLVLLPLLVFMVYGFSSTEEIEKEVMPLMDINSTEKHTARSIDLKILEDGNYSVDGVNISKNMLASTVNKLHQDITSEVRNNIMNIHVSSTKEISKKEVWFIYNTLLDYGFYRIVTPNQEVLRGKGNTSFKVADSEEDNSPNIDETLELFLSPDGTLFHEGKAIELTDIETIQPLKDNMSFNIKTNLNTSQELVKATTQSIFRYVRDKGIKKVSVCVDSSEDNKSEIDKVKEELKSMGALKINYKEAYPKQLLGFWYNAEKDITFYIQENNGGLLWDIKTKESDFVRYYPKKKNNGYTFTYKGNQLFFVLKNGILIDSKENKYTRIDKPKITQKAATSQQMHDYNNKAKYYNAMLKKNVSIKMSDVKRLKHLYSIMSEKQRNDAEPFPDFPKPPPTPKTPNMPKVLKADTIYMGINIPPPPPEAYQSAKRVKIDTEFKVIPPPPPKTPPTIEEMAEKKAIFYLEGKRISSDEAIRIVNKNKDINIQIIYVDSKHPTVKLSKKGIRVKTKN